MAVNYSVSGRKNPTNPSAPKKFYAQAQSAGEATFKSMCAIISDRCTVTASDSKAVLDAFVTVMTSELQAGRIVRLGDFGSFQISISSQGAVSEKEYTQSLIKGSKIVFRPGEDLKIAVKTLKYEKVAKLPVKTKEPAGE